MYMSMWVWACVCVCGCVCRCACSVMGMYGDVDGGVDVGVNVGVDWGKTNEMQVVNWHSPSPHPLPPSTPHHS